MPIQIYNTLSRKKEIFKPMEKGKVSMYSCGPTVYDTPHLGNYRTFVMNDLLRRMLQYNDLEVTQVMNITDVDDKTIRRSREEKVPLKTVTERYEKLFLDGLESLNILTPNRLVRATENIQRMIDLIQTLIDKSAAYISDDGVYMSIAKVENYGQLANLHIESQVKNRERIANDEYDKDNPRDFAVWKFKTPDDAGVSWQAPFGEGRPGWHIECSAMAMAAFGPTIDIHTGGNDLIFPHHTNEIAQSESATGNRFANYWVHGGFMTIKEEKMSKSKSNIVRLEDLTTPSPADSPLSPLAYRYWLLTAHYRSPISFSFEAVRGAQNALIRLIEAVSGYPEDGRVITAYKDRFEAFINDDLDMPRALALVWDLTKDDSQSPADKRATIIDFDRVFGLNIGAVKNVIEEDIPEEITVLAEARKEARSKKDWRKADALRGEIEKRGFEVRDIDDDFVIKNKS